MRNKIKVWIEWSELVLKIVTIIGAIFVAWQYFDSKEAQKVKQTTELAKTFNSGDLLKARLKINTAWDGQREFLDELSYESVGDDLMIKEIKADIVNSLVEKYRETADEKMGLESEILQLINFYHNVKVMVENHICDEKSAKDFFQKFAKEFYTLFEPYIQKRRVENRKYANSLEYVAKGFEL